MGYKPAKDLYQKDNDWIGVVIAICIVVGLVIWFA